MVPVNPFSERKIKLMFAAALNVKVQVPLTAMLSITRSFKLTAPIKNEKPPADLVTLTDTRYHLFSGSAAADCVAKFSNTPLAAETFKTPPEILALAVSVHPVGLSNPPFVTNSGDPSTLMYRVRSVGSYHAPCSLAANQSVGGDQAGAMSGGTADQAQMGKTSMGQLALSVAGRRGCGPYSIPRL
jgi:hypothetical protein